MRLIDLTDAEAKRLYDTYCVMPYVSCSKCKYSLGSIFCLLTETKEEIQDYDNSSVLFKEKISKEDFLKLINEDEDIEEYLKSFISVSNMSLIEVFDFIYHLANSKFKLSKEINVKIGKIRNILLEGGED